MLTAGAGRENADCWCRKGECLLLEHEGRMLTAGAGRKNADCWCRKENANCLCGKAVSQETRMEVQEVRMLTAGAGRENADCWCRK